MQGLTVTAPAYLQHVLLVSLLSPQLCAAPPELVMCGDEQAVNAEHVVMADDGKLPQQMHLQQNPQHCLDGQQ